MGCQEPGAGVAAPQAVHLDCMLSCQDVGEGNRTEKRCRFSTAVCKSQAGASGQICSNRVPSSPLSGPALGLEDNQAVHKAFPWLVLDGWVNNRENENKGAQEPRGWWGGAVTLRKNVTGAKEPVRGEISTG